MEGRPRVAIVGGGPAGLSAAYHLSEIYRDFELDITVYQLGWRLGGKAATGRDPDKHHRIEEHGIHGFCKFYFDAWDMMKGVYDQVGAGSRNPATCLPVKRIEDAFLPSSTVYSVESVDACWTSEVGAMPEGGGSPWDGNPDLRKRAIISGLLENIWKRNRDRPPGLLDSSDLLARPASAEMQRVAQALHEILLATFDQAQSALQDIDDADEETLRGTMEKAASMLDPGRPHLALLFRQMDSPIGHVQVQRGLTSLDLGLSLFRGLLAARFWANSFDLDDLDRYDYRDWLHSHDANDHTLASAAVITVANMLFAYPDGDSTREPKLSAASWLNWVLRSVVGKGAYFHFFAAGSGETVSLPLYKALVARGVKFEFFHKLKAVKSSGSQGSRFLDELVFERQAKTKGPSYDPLAKMDGPDDGASWCVWPNQPNWDQLEYGDTNHGLGADYEDWEGRTPTGASERVLKRGAKNEGFDYVVWALPSSMIPHVGDSGMKDEWQETITQLPYTSTQAIQIWLTKDTNELGWPRRGLPRKTSRYGSGSFPNPLSGMVAFDDLIRFEGWPHGGRPNGLIYFCSPIQRWPGGLTRDEDRLRVRQSASATLRLLGNFLVGARLPEADRPDPQAIDFGYLYDPDPDHYGEQRLAFQYARANTRPTEAYIQAPAGSVRGRRDAWDSGYRNLTVAGDWMYNGFNLGSFESAVTGGKLAAFALLGRMSVGDLRGLTFLHPRARQRAQDAIDKGIVPMIH